MVSMKTVCGHPIPTPKPRTAHKWNGEVIDFLLERRPNDPPKQDFSKAMVAGPNGWELPWWYGKKE